MTFKKSLKSKPPKKGQAVAEYFILLCLMIVITIAGFATFLPGLKNAADTTYDVAAEKINEADSGFAEVATDQIRESMRNWITNLLGNTE